jgi:hypothetical protein
LPDAAPKGSVQKIDTAEAAKGVVFGSLHLEQMEDKTQGEQLKDIQASRKKEIQRPVDDEKAWDALNGTTKARVNDLFLAGLEAQMKKLAQPTKPATDSK